MRNKLPLLGFVKLVKNDLNFDSVGQLRILIVQKFLKF